MTRTSKKFVIRPLHRDVAAVVLRHEDKALSVVDIFRELFHDNGHRGWEAELVVINMVCDALTRRGFLRADPWRCYSSTERTEVLLDGEGC